MRKYETIYIVQPDLPEEEVTSLTDKVREIITAQKGEVTRLEDWGTRKLAYPIRKFPRGRYFYLRFDGNQQLVAELERRLRLDDRVLRYQSVKIEKEAAPAPAAEPAPEVAAPVETEQPAAE